MDFNNVDDQTWRDEPAEDGRVEDGEVTECAGCNVTMHLVESDNKICPLCAWEGYAWKKAYLIRRGDTIRMGGVNHLVTADEPFGRRVCIYAGDTTGDICWMKGALDMVLVREET
jgi:hypothetical protein